MAGGRNGIAPSIIVVVGKATARFLGASIDDMLAGRFTPTVDPPYCKQPMPG